MQIALRELAEITRGRFHGPDVMIGGLSTDSRNIRPGDLFIALRGTHVDGHGFIPAALECGASAVLLEEAAQIAPPGVFPRVIVKDTFQALGAIGAWYRRRFLGKLLCVTGSNGKTILKDILYRIMAPVLGVSRNRGSYNSRLGVPLALLSMEMSDALWITEAGVSEPGDMKYLQEILRPDCGILTNIGMAHIGGFGTRENIAREKLRLFLEIPREGWVLLPGDEPLVENWAEELSCRVFFLNREKEQIPWFEPLVHMGSRVALTVHFPGEAMPRRIILRTPSR
ncbi:UDP-N-acetylmuramoyl-tripeptide--D-alanyl-D-alanine ligase, partial [Myxococcota bacterium]|nr:UDP-N-acetylmuramoyl-tripeptide--D-alanyl-D-alanine ligase [Myxococcota bacterium]